MSASRNKKSNSGGLRVLWIPGRKKHNHKGSYGSTNKHNNYSTISNNRQQGKNELWSVGGTIGHQELAESNISESAVSGSKVGDILLPAACVTVSEVNLQKDVNNMKFEPKENINSIEKDIENCSIKGILNDESDLNATSKDDIDVPDISLQNQNDQKLSKTKKHKKKNKNKNEQNLNHDDEQQMKDDKDEATVKCLYYTLMCCECTIS